MLSFNERLGELLGEGVYNRCDVIDYSDSGELGLLTDSVSSITMVFGDRSDPKRYYEYHEYFWDHADAKELQKYLNNVFPLEENK